MDRNIHKVGRSTLSKVQPFQLLLLPLIQLHTFKLESCQLQPQSIKTELLFIQQLHWNPWGYNL